MNAIIKIALVDDEVLFRKGIAFLLQREDNIEIIFEASNGEELVNKLLENEVKPDIIIMDLKMPVLNGVEATKIIRKSFPEIKIIALTSYDSKSFIANMIQQGIGISIVPESLVNLMGNNVTSIQLENVELSWHLGVIWRKDAYLNHVTRKWIEFISEMKPT